jgi:hypothetical protein
MKCVYDTTTGKIWAWVRDDQDVEAVMSNYTNVAYAEVDAPKLSKFTCWKWRYDIVNQELVEIAS